MLSAYKTKLYQLITGFATTAAVNLSVFPTIQAVNTPPPLPPVTKRLDSSIYPFLITKSTPDIKSS